MNSPLMDDTWVRCGTSLLWDTQAMNRVCSPEAVRSLREFLRLHQAGWPEDTLKLIQNRTIVVAGLEAAMDTLHRDEAPAWLEKTVYPVVLTHRVATASPRRFLIADEVGLGKTIEAALILRELISRGELKRALMVVPAGLVNIWHRELNEVFHLNFEVFGSEGDVTDRKSNAFEKHHLLIASIDTLKLRARMARLKAAPPWDLVVFDEAHHWRRCAWVRRRCQVDGDEIGRHPDSGGRARRGARDG